MLRRFFRLGGDPTSSGEQQHPSALSADMLAADAASPGCGIMGNVIDVQTGDLAVAEGEALLQASGIGSCVVVACLDPTAKVGGLAHIMLPNFPLDTRAPDDTKYAGVAIPELVQAMLRFGADRSRIHTCVVGGGNVLERQDDTICEANIKSVYEQLQGQGLSPCREDIRGTRRRRLAMNIATGTIHASAGDDPERVLLKC